MNKKIIVLFAIISIPLYAREIRTPLPFEIQFRNPMYLLNGRRTPEWAIDVWTGGYQRGTSQAFCSSQSCCDPCPLSQLIFNKSDFTAAQTFANSTASSILNPFLNSTLSPRIRFKDQGAMFGIDAIKDINEKWSVGFRAKIPYRRFKTEPCTGAGIGTSDLNGLQASDIFRNKTETIDGNQIETYAYRLDFLSLLPVDCKAPGINFLMVDYHDASFTNMPITISNQDITENTLLAPNDRNSVTVIKSSNTPPTECGIPVATAQSLPLLGADGSNVSEGDRARFTQLNNYTPLGQDPATQSNLWIVPSVDTAINRLVPPALIIKDHVNQILGCLNGSAEALFAACNDISFACQEQSGIGDLDSEYFFQYHISKRSFIEGFTGIKFPTGKDTDCPNLVYLQPLGNNGHPELKLGFQSWWHPNDWFVLTSDMLYGWALCRTEKIAAAFCDAQIKNIGPTVSAEISWGYFLAHLNAQFCLCPHEQHEISALISYELYHKQKDDIHLCMDTATDCLGAVQPLSALPLKQNTNQTAHKIVGELSYCYVGSEWIDFAIFGGFNRVIAGNNVPKEHGWQIGVSLTFFVT